MHHPLLTSCCASPSFFPISVSLQKAIQENHTTQRRHMKSTNRLIKAQEDVDHGTVTADTATTKVAAEAATRSQHSQQESRKLTKKMESHISNSKDSGISQPGGPRQDSEAVVRDIHKGSVHQLDIHVVSDHLPWLKGLGSNVQPRIDRDHERQTRRDSERLTSPDSGVMDHLSEVTESLDGTASSSTCTHSVTSTPHLISKSHVMEVAQDSNSLLPPPDSERFRFGAPIRLQNGELPPHSDYPILPPPKDYPIVGLGQQPATSGNLAGDAYTVQDAMSNSRPVKVTARIHQSGHVGAPPASGSPIRSRPTFS